MIIRGGENIYPREIEEFLYQHPAISEVQVFGVPDEKMGEEVCAWIQLNAGQKLSADDVKDYCRDKITHFKIPRYIDFVDEYPMTVTGKIQKFVMRENALMIDETERREQRLFGEFMAAWPSDDVVGLWLYLRKHGSRLGGNTGPFALRTLGVDTFLFTQDVEGFLRSHGIVDGGRNSQRALNAAQAYFNDLREQSGRPLAELSRIISFCHGQNRVY